MVESRALKAPWPLARPARLLARSRPGSWPRAGEREGHHATPGECQHYDSVSSDRAAAMVGNVRRLMLARSKKIAAARQTYAASIKGAKRGLLILTSSMEGTGLLSTVNLSTSYVVAFPPFPISNRRRYEPRKRSGCRWSLVLCPLVRDSNHQRDHQALDLDW